MRADAVYHTAIHYQITLSLHTHRVIKRETMKVHLYNKFQCFFITFPNNFEHRLVGKKRDVYVLKTGNKKPLTKTGYDSMTQNNSKVKIVNS